MAVVDVCFTAGAGEAGSAEASVAPVSVLAGGTVPAGALNTLVDVNLTSLTLPPRRTGTREALVVFRLLALAPILAGVAGTGSQHISTSGSSIGGQAVALESSNSINAGSLVQARIGSTFVDVCLAIGTTESLPAGADVASGHVFTGAAVHTRVGLALIVVDVTVGTTPAQIAVTLKTI